MLHSRHRRSNPGRLYLGRGPQAAKLDVASAKAGFYPSLSIEAGIGYDAFNPKHLVTTPESMVFNLAGNLTAPLINRQAIKAQYFGWQ